MVTTSRIIVVLRRDLGNQLIQVRRKLKAVHEELDSKSFEEKQKGKNLYKEQSFLIGTENRLMSTIQSLGALTLGDLEDEEYEGDF